jgi:hypothetical protein
VGIVLNRKTPYNSPSAGGRELGGGGFHPHLNPLLSRERNFMRDYAANHKYRILEVWDFEFV